MAAAKPAGGVERLPPLTDTHALFNLSVAPPLALASRPSGGTVIPIRRQEEKSDPQSKGTFTRLRGVLKRMTSEPQQLTIGSPVNFRHVVHVDHGKVEVYDRAHADPSFLPPPQPVTLVRKAGGFGMNLKTVDGHTYVTLVAEGGAAADTGLIQVGNEITAIDGESIVNLPHDEVIARLKSRNSVLLLIVATREAAASAGNGPAVCRVCSKAASFNCSACGPSVLYCSSECQKKDWAKHSSECVSVSADRQNQVNSTGTTSTGPCRVCRDHNGRFQCACRTVIYCSQKCQGVDWPTHKQTCSYVTGIPPPPPSSAAPVPHIPAPGAPTRPAPYSRPASVAAVTAAAAPRPVATASTASASKTATSEAHPFVAASGRFVFKMAFKGGSFEPVWIVDLLSVEASSLPTTLLPTKTAIYASVGPYLYCLEPDRGDVRWRKELGYPFEFEARSLAKCVEDDIVSLVVGAAGHLIVFDPVTGLEVHRKLLSPDFLPVGLYSYRGTLVAACDRTAFGVTVDARRNVILTWRTSLEHNALPQSLAPSITVSGPSNAPPATVIVNTGIMTSMRFAKGDVLAATAPSAVGGMCSIVAGTDGSVVKVEAGVLSRYDPSTLRQIWSKPVEACEGREGTLLFNHITISLNDGDIPSTRQVVYVGIYFRVLCVNMEDGEILWVAGLQSPKQDDPALGLVGLVRVGEYLIASTGGRFFALHATTGNPLRKSQMPRATYPEHLAYMSGAEEVGDESLPSGMAACLPHY